MRLYIFVVIFIFPTISFSAENQVWKPYYAGSPYFSTPEEGCSDVFLKMGRPYCHRVIREFASQYLCMGSSTQDCKAYGLAGYVFLAGCPIGKNAIISEDGLSMTCGQCPEGQFINPYNNRCQAPCPLPDTIHSEFESAPGEFHTGTYCAGGCAVRSEVVVNICGAIDLPGAECAMAGQVFSYTGEMCGGSNPPPSVPTNPPGCADDKERFENLCLPKCGEKMSRATDGRCFCTDSKDVLLNGQCVPSSCPTGQHLEGGQCVGNPVNPNCAEGEVSDPNGQCIPNCPENYAVLNGKCIPASCPTGQHLEGGQCVDNPVNPNCAEGEVSDPNGQCVSGCEKGYALLNGQCTTPSCPAGQSYSVTLKKCVNEGSQCKVGELKDSAGNCVPIVKPDCPEGSYWLAVCNRCVKAAEPVPQCSASQSTNDIDGDGIPNSEDSDIDGDGIPNVSDSDKDGDGIPDVVDFSPSGPGTSGSGPGTNDIDGDGIPNDLDGDIDGDGVPNDQDGSPNGGGDGTGNCNPQVEKCDITGAGNTAQGPGKLWESKGVKFSDIWESFVKDVRGAPIFKAGEGFFDVRIFSGRCPVWTLRATRFWSDITIDFQCSSEFLDAFEMLSVVVLLSAAWIAFRIAFL